MADKKLVQHELDKFEVSQLNQSAIRTVDVYDASDIRYDPSDTAPIYIGLHKTVGAPTSSNTWLIYKYTYSGSAVSRIEKQVGIWDNRASLTW